MIWANYLMNPPSPLPLHRGSSFPLLPPAPSIQRGHFSIAAFDKISVLSPPLSLRGGYRFWRCAKGQRSTCSLPPSFNYSSYHSTTIKIGSKTLQIVYAHVMCVCKLRQMWHALMADRRYSHLQYLKARRHCEWLLLTKNRSFESVVPQRSSCLGVACALSTFLVFPSNCYFIKDFVFLCFYILSKVSSLIILFFCAFRAKKLVLSLIINISEN